MNARRTNTYIVAIVMPLLFCMLLSEAHACSAELENDPSARGLALCAQENYQVADKRLNKIYHECIRELKNSRNDISVLRKSEVQWIAQRDDICDKRADEDALIDATGDAVILDCKTEWTDKRIDWLERNNPIKGLENGCHSPAEIRK